MFERKDDIQSQTTTAHQGSLGKYVGGGLSGNVYELNGNNGRPLIIHNRKWVVKETFFSHPIEEKITAQHYLVFSKENTKKPNTFFKYHYFVMEKVEGVRLDEVRMTLLQRLEIASLIIQNLNHFHHYTPGSYPILHNDILPGNVLVDIDKETGRIKRVSFIDFGRSIKMNDDNPDVLHHDPTISFPEQRPHTGHENRTVGFARAGIKSDIYQVAGLLQEHVLNVFSNPFTKLNITICDIDVIKLTNDFFNSMREHDYEKRPGSDEALVFFNTLCRLYKIHEINIDDADIKVALIAKLILIKNRQWKDIIGVEEKSGDRQSWKNFDFESENNIWVCRAIIHISKHTKLCGCVEGVISNDIEAAERVTVMHNSDDIIRYLADKLNVNFLCQIQGTTKQRKDVSLSALSHLFIKASNIQNIEMIVRKLELLKKENKICFLHARQGNYCTYSFHNHKWNGEKVSGTWVKIMKMADEKINMLQIRQERDRIHHV